MDQTLAILTKFFVGLQTADQALRSAAAERLSGARGAQRSGEGARMLINHSSILYVCVCKRERER